MAPARTWGAAGRGSAPAQGWKVLQHPALGSSVGLEGRRAGRLSAARGDPDVLRAAACHPSWGRADPRGPQCLRRR